LGQWNKINYRRAT